MHIAILSFNRPYYLSQVLSSLRPQVSESDEIVLFQDGAVNAFSGRVTARQEDIRACVALFRQIIPWGRVRESGRNLGIALNYDRAERYFFRWRWRPHGLFLEDDLVLSPNYMRVTRALLDMAEANRRIAYVSAYGNLWASPEEQRRRGTELQHMHENWGFAMTRKAWLDERPFRRKYLALVARQDYAKRDHDRIRGFYTQRGWKTKVSSQDAARWVASIELGKVRVTTFACHARYIGEKGEHFTPQLYYASGFDKTQMFAGTPAEVMPPSSEQIDTWVDTERKRFKGEIGPFYPGHGSVAAAM